MKVYVFLREVVQLGLDSVLIYIIKHRGSLVRSKSCLQTLDANGVET